MVIRAILKIPMGCPGMIFGMIFTGNFRVKFVISECLNTLGWKFVLVNQLLVCDGVQYRVSKSIEYRVESAAGGQKAYISCQ